MHHLKCEFGKLYRTRIICIMILFLVAIAVLAPISTYLDSIQYGYFEIAGSNPFQYWLLNYSSGWGCPLYLRLFFIFPILATGLLYFSESVSSVRNIVVSKMGRCTYFSTKILSVFISTFLIFLFFFLLNSLVTHICFQGEDITEEYKNIVPLRGSFAYSFYQISPLAMEIMYGFINSLAQAILSVIALCIQLIGKFRNKYAAFIIPFFVMYLIDYITQIVAVSQLKRPFLCLTGIIQPSMCWSLTSAPSVSDLLFVFGVLFTLMICLVIVGVFRNGDLIEWLYFTRNFTLYLVFFHLFTLLLYFVLCHFLLEA